jgi:Rieske Fe-S protein
MRKDRRDSEAMSRRDLLALAGGVAAATAVSGLVGCSSGNEAPAMVEVALDAIPEGGRLEVLLGEMPVELRKTADGVEARSLWCTHSGCHFKWRSDQEIYFCPCHEGKYNANGKPISGPPPRPLTEVPVIVDGTTIRVGGVPA